MTYKNKSLKLIATSVFSLILVIVVSIGMETLADVKVDADKAGKKETVSDIDVFGNISFVDLEISEEDFSFDEMSEFVGSADIDDVYSESKDVSLQETSGEESLLEESESNEISSENSEASEESKEDPSESLSSGNDSSEENSSDGGDDNSETNGEYPSAVTLLDGGEKPFVFFQQDDPKYENIPYGTDKIGSHGCGPVNMAMIISTYTGEVVYPEEAAKWSYNHGYWTEGKGSSHALMTEMAKAYGVPVKTISKSTWAETWTEAINALKEGKCLVTRVGKGDFSAGPHFITIRGITEDGKLLVANSISYEDSVKEWSQTTVKNNINLDKFWVYG